MKKAENLMNCMKLDYEDYEFLEYLVEKERNYDNSNEIDKLLEKLNNLFELYKNNYEIDEIE